MRNKPIAVLISDVHYSVNNLNLASASLRHALSHAELLSVPLIVAGDLMDTKAIIRAECANDVIETLSAYPNVRKLVMVGNHDLINEKGEAHSLNFLKPLCELIDYSFEDQSTGLQFIPYQTDPTEIRRRLAEVAFGQTIIMHQGLKGAKMGEYIIDKTSIEPEIFDGFRVVSGHYHQAQDIKCGKTGLWSYIGTPYSITAAEANDGPKGFRVLNKDGSLDFVPTNLRKHVTVERTVESVLEPISDLKSEDILCIKVTGPSTELRKLNKKAIGLAHLGHENFKLDKVYLDTPVADEQTNTKLTGEELFDSLIDDSGESKTQIKYMKNLWRELVDASR